MKLSAKLKPTWWDGLIIILCIAAALGCWRWLLGSISGNQGDLVAVITVSGNEVKWIELKADADFTIEANGYTLELCAGDNGICVRSSDCSGQDCMRMGRIDHAGESIVCLPAQLAIRLEYAVENREAEIDAVIG